MKRSLPVIMVDRSIFDAIQELSEKSGVPIGPVIEEVLRKGLGQVSPQMPRPCALWPRP